MPSRAACISSSSSRCPMCSGASGCGAACFRPAHRSPPTSISASWRASSPLPAATSATSCSMPPTPPPSTTTRSPWHTCCARSRVNTPSAARSRARRSSASITASCGSRAASMAAQTGEPTMPGLSRAPTAGIRRASPSARDRPAAKADPAPRSSGIGNQQWLHASGAARAPPRLSHPADAREYEATRIADAAVGGQPVVKVQPESPAAGEPMHRAPSAALRRDVAASRAADAVRGGGEPLGNERSRLSEAVPGDFGGVRIHTHAAAAHAAQAIGARAYTFGQDIAFAPGEYDPSTTRGRHLLAHELAHTQQERAQPTDTLHRQGDDGGAANVSELDTGTSSTALATAAPDPAASPTVAGQEPLSLDDRVAAFKRLVLGTARARLASNRANLAIWRQVVEGLELGPKQQLAIEVAQLQEIAPEHHVEADITESNPIRRAIKLGQPEGHYIACTGCHLEQQATRLENETPEWQRTGPEWTPIADRLTGVSPRDRPYLAPLVAAGPLPGFEFPPRAVDTDILLQFLQAEAGSTTPESRSHDQPAPAFPQYAVPSRPSREEQMAQVNALTGPYRPIIQALGPDGYKVWTDSLTEWESQNIEAVRNGILSRIDQRQADYLELIGMILEGDREYYEFVPVVHDLLPLADPDVREVIDQEREDREDVGLLESIIVGIATLGALLLTIFPPTTALGVAAFGALEVGLGVYGAVRGPEMFEQGYAYSLGTGARDVYTEEQSSSGGTMMFFGFITAVTAPLMIASGGLRTLGAASAIGEAGALSRLTPEAAMTQGLDVLAGSKSLGPGVLQQGRLILTYEADGVVIGTIEGNPNVLMIARDGEAVMYVRTADGGLEVAARAPLNAGLLPESTAAETGLAVPWDEPAAAGLVEAGPQTLALPPGGQPLARLPGRSPFLLTAGEETASLDDVFAELAQEPGSGFGEGIVWSVTPDGTVFATPPVRGIPIYAPEGVTPPASYFAGPGQPRSWVMSGPLQEGFTPFDIFPGEAPTTQTLPQVRGARGSNLRGSAAEQYIAELSGGEREVTLQLPADLTRRSDVISPSVAGSINQEVKNYLRFIGQGNPAREVPLTAFMQSEITRDAMIMYYYRQQPVWIFTDAPPSAALQQALDDAGIPWTVSSDRLPTP